MAIYLWNFLLKQGVITIPLGCRPTRGPVASPVAAKLVEEKRWDVWDSGETAAAELQEGWAASAGLAHQGAVTDTAAAELRAS